MAAVATAAVPSNSNLRGGLAGLVATAAVGYLSQAGYIAIAATAVGLPAASMTVLVVGIIATIANVAITHVSELKTADALLKDIQSISSIPDYVVVQQSPLEPSGTTTLHSITNLK